MDKNKIRNDDDKNRMQPKKQLHYNGPAYEATGNLKCSHSQSESRTALAGFAHPVVLPLGREGGPSSEENKTST